MPGTGVVRDGRRVRFICMALGLFAVCVLGEPTTNSVDNGIANDISRSQLQTLLTSACKCGRFATDSRTQLSHEMCTQLCEHSGHMRLHGSNSAIAPPRLRQLCHNDTSMWLQVDSHDSAFNANNRIMVYWLNNVRDSTEKPIYNITKNTTFLVNNLTANSIYNTSISFVRYDGEFRSSSAQEFATRDSNLDPRTVKATNVQTHLVGSTSAHDSMDVEITWDNPLNDCFFTVHMAYTPDSKAEQTPYLRNDQPGSRNVTFTNVPLHGGRFYVENSTNWTTFGTDCRALYGNTLSRLMCVPEQPPTDITVGQIATQQGYKLNVHWTPPDEPPIRYKIQVLNETRDSITAPYFVDGTANESDLNGTVFSPNSYLYVVVWSLNSLNKSSQSNEADPINLPELPPEATMKTYAAMGVLMLVLVGLLAEICRRYRNRRAAQRLSAQTHHERHLVNVQPNNKAHQTTPPSPLTVLQLEINELCANAMLLSQLAITSDRVRLYELIGKGEFGDVYSGRLMPEQRLVAVKTLRQRASRSAVGEYAEERRAFLNEIKLMCDVGVHDNVLRIVGHVCGDVRHDMLLVTEYCSEGSLRDFLQRVFDERQRQRQQRKLSEQLLERLDVPVKADGDTGSDNNEMPGNIVTNPTYMDQFRPMPSPTIPRCDDHQPPALERPNNNYTAPDGNIVHNLLYESLDKPTDSAKPSATHHVVAGADLVAMAAQVAAGMHHLGQHKVVHRDLAARNVLVCVSAAATGDCRLVCKVSDFGLSRDVYTDNEYLKGSRPARLPFKWLALESIERGSYSTQSDVWSFGVLLHELVTLGGSPYPACRNGDELLRQLRAGWRMERWRDVSAELYGLQLVCWSEVAERRPTFEVLRARLERMRWETAEGSREHVRLERVAVAAKAVPVLTGGLDYTMLCDGKVDSVVVL